MDRSPVRVLRLAYSARCSICSHPFYLQDGGKYFSGSPVGRCEIRLGISTRSIGIPGSASHCASERHVWKTQCNPHSNHS